MGQRNKMRLWDLTKDIYSYRDVDPTYSINVGDYTIHKTNHLELYNKDVTFVFTVRDVSEYNYEPTFRVTIKDNQYYVELFVNEKEVVVSEVKGFTKETILQTFEDVAALLHQLTEEYNTELETKTKVREELSKQLTEV